MKHFFYYLNDYVPCCSDWTNIGLVKKHFALDPTVDYGKCLLVEEDNEMQLNENELLCADIRIYKCQFQRVNHFSYFHIFCILLQLPIERR